MLQAISISYKAAILRLGNGDNFGVVDRIALRGLITRIEAVCIVVRQVGTWLPGFLDPE